MKLIPNIFQYANIASHRLGSSHLIRNFSIFSESFPDGYDRQKQNAFESSDVFERRIFGDSASGDSDNLFTRKLDKIQREKAGMRFYFDNKNRSAASCDGEDGVYDTTSDGMDDKLKEAAFFDIDDDEVDEEDYCYRYDINIQHGMVLPSPRALDVTKPIGASTVPRDEFETTTEEVLRKADFRNVRFLANFITEAGIIIKRKKTGISAKAQRRIAREVKTARAFGLMPFTCMGTKEFAFGRTMESLDEDFEYTNYASRDFVDEE